MTERRLQGMVGISLFLFVLVLVTAMLMKATRADRAINAYMDACNNPIGIVTGKKVVNAYSRLSGTELQYELYTETRGKADGKEAVVQDRFVVDKETYLACNVGDEFDRSGYRKEYNISYTFFIPVLIGLFVYPACMAATKG